MFCKKWVIANLMTFGLTSSMYTEKLKSKCELQTILPPLFDIYLSQTGYFSRKKCRVGLVCIVVKVLITEYSQNKCEYA